MWAHSFKKDDVTYIQSMGVRCGLRLALECVRISREFEGEVLMKSGSMANQRAQFIADWRTSANTRHLATRR